MILRTALQTAAFGLFVLGIMIAVSAAAKMPAKGETWPDTLPWFLAGAFAGVVGLVGWRMGSRTKGADRPGIRQDAAWVFQYLRDCHARATQIGQELDVLDAAALCERIDDLLSDTIPPLVENRSVLVATYGMKRGSDILLQVAVAERNFNRTWSAAADGCLPEAHNAFQKALATLEELVESWDR